MPFPLAQSTVDSVVCQEVLQNRWGLQAMHGIVVSQETIDKWLKRKEKIEAELVELNKKLEAVHLLAGSAASEGEPRRIKSGSKQEEMGKVLREVLQDFDTPLSPQQIKDVLDKKGESMEVWGNKYLNVHQILRREKNLKRIRMVDDGKYVLVAPSRHPITQQRLKDLLAKKLREQEQSEIAEEEAIPNGQ